MDLPPEINLLIFDFLGPKDLCFLSMTSKDLRNFLKTFRLSLLREILCDVKKARAFLNFKSYPKLSQEKVSAKLFVDPFGVAEKSLELEGSFGTKCRWAVSKAMFHGPFRTKTVDACDILTKETGKYRRHKLDGLFIRKTDNGEILEKTYRRGRLIKRFENSEIEVSVTEWKCFTNRKTRKKVHVSFTKKFVRSVFPHLCENSGLQERSWWYFREAVKEGKTVEKYSEVYAYGDSCFTLESEGRPKKLECVVQGTQFLRSFCCEKHSTKLLKLQVEKNISPEDFDVFFDQ